LSDEEKLNEEIRKKGAKWVAGETSMSRLSPEERAKRLGLNPKPEEKKAEKKKGG
jgi:hypothetical protein